MAAKLPHIEVSAGIIYRHGMFLATQIPDGKPYAGYWELPGGKREGNETPEQALERELGEELGIRIREYAFLEKIRHNYEDFEVEICFYLITAFDGLPSPREDQNVRWILPQDIDDLDFLPADAKLLRRIKDGLLNNA